MVQTFVLLVIPILPKLKLQNSVVFLQGQVHSYGHFSAYPLSLHAFLVEYLRCSNETCIIYHDVDEISLCETNNYFICVFL